MKVILLKNIPKLGKKDDIIEVNEGYANNALFPQRLAVPATNSAISALEVRKQQKVAEKEIQHHLLDRAIEDLQNMNISISVPVNDKGNLFSKIDEKDISEIIKKEKDIYLDVKYLNIENGPIKSVGTYKIKVSDGDYTSFFDLEISKK